MVINFEEYYMVGMLNVYENYTLKMTATRPKHQTVNIQLYTSGVIPGHLLSPRL